MKHHLSVLLGLAVSLGCAQFGVVLASAQDNAEHYTQAQVKELRREARTPAQYGVLAHYYDGQQKKYSALAATEQQEWTRRSKDITSISAKYPRPVDSARNLYEYYAYRADEATKLSLKYQQLADPSKSSQPN